MTAREIPDRPAWLISGEDVLCYNVGGTTTNTNSRATRIARVASQSFTVAAEQEPRFRIGNRYCEVRQGGTWGWTRRVVPLDSVEAGEVLTAEDAQRRENRARAAVDDWVRKRNREARLAAIAALQAIDND